MINFDTIGVVMRNFVDIVEKLQKEQERLFADNNALLNELKTQLDSDAEADDAVLNKIKNAKVISQPVLILI